MLIGEDGFYYRNGLRPGRFFPYRDISDVQVSSGRAVNGSNYAVCTFKTREGQNFKFSMLPADVQAAEYLVCRVQAFASSDSGADGERTYVMDGKFYGKTAIVASAAGFAVVLGFCIVAVGAVGYACFAGAAAAFGALVYNVAVYFYFKVIIGPDGFYVRTSPFNGRYYKYSQIRACDVRHKVYRHRMGRRGGINDLHYFYFIFTPADDSERRFLFRSYEHSHEIEVLRSRIEAQKG